MEIKDLPIPEPVKQVVTKTGITKLYPLQMDAIKARALEGRREHEIMGPDAERLIGQREDTIYSLRMAT